MSFICNYDNRSSFDYIFSVYTKDDPDLIALKKRVAENNKFIRTFARRHKNVRDSIVFKKVRLMARGPRRIWAKQDFQYSRFGTYPQYDASLPHKYAEYFDVYCGEDRDALIDLKREINEGLTRSQYNKICELEYQANALRWEAKMRVA